MKVFIVAALLASVALAGCSDGGSAPVDPKDPGQLKKGTGAIAGLLLDDRYRPIAGGSLLVQETAQRTTSNGDGEFFFLDLEPGTYRLRAEVPGHEALPVSVTVQPAVFVEQRVIAQRLISEGGTIITREYAVFIPCAADYVANGGNIPCSLDLGDDEYSSAYESTLMDLENVTYVVTEFKANQENDYEVQVRDDTTSDDDQQDDWRQFAAARFSGDYVKIVNRVGEANVEHAVEAYGANEPFAVDQPFTTLFFVDHALAKDLVPGTCCGAGASMGIKGTFVQSVFLGEPEVDIGSYGVYS